MRTSRKTRISSLFMVALSCALTGCAVGGIAVGTDEDRRTPLEGAAQAGNLAEVERLLASGADPNDRGVTFGAPLNAAASRNGNSAVIRTLLAAGANPNGRPEEGNTCWVPPLQHAVSTADLDSVRILLDAGARIPRSSCSQLVAGWLRPEVIELLRRHGFDLFATDQLGRNQLHLALEHPGIPLVDGVEYLVNAGVPLNVRDHNGKTPLAYWREPRDFERHWFRVWLMERFGDISEFQRQRVDRATISALLERAGAKL